ncbi:hypothetical protein FQN49_001634 [Arthroderma sp. PD_2]|nr:hypothetical protein FQN49_001634 [Arthroderma sp. PD_2]
MAAATLASATASPTPSTTATTPPLPSHDDTPTPPNTSSITTARSPRDDNLAKLKSWTEIDDDEFESNDREVAIWYEENKKSVYEKIETLKTDGVAAEVAALLMGNKEGGLRGVQQILSMLPEGEKASVLKYLGSS